LPSFFGNNICKKLDQEELVLKQKISLCSFSHFFNQLGLHCATADPDGFEEAAMRCNGIEDSDQDTPILRGHDLSAQQVQALTHTVEQCVKVARLAFFLRHFVF
jgi:hypothetical protein